MTFEERNALCRAKRVANNRQCAGSVPNYRGGLSECKRAATLDYDGKRYCNLHYPPNVAAREPAKKENRRAWLLRELKKLGE